MRSLRTWAIHAVVSLALLYSAVPAPLASQESDRITFHDANLFLNGGNVAWIDFARDIGPGTTRVDLFDDMFREMRLNGGNSFRLWLHTNGANTPEFSGTGSEAVVVGPGVGAINDLRAILDLAYFHDIGLQLCLWSFDMLHTSQYGSTITSRNRVLLTDTTKLQAYIDNALIPMVDSLKGHPALLAWEIFNEPEGMSTTFGWTSTADRVTMEEIQRFVNRTAGAIRRTDPNVYVTNGSWSFRASSDSSSLMTAAGQPKKSASLSESELEGMRIEFSRIYRTEFTRTDAALFNDRLAQPMAGYNYYRDDRLIASGGDTAGTLDFYSVHYYEHFGEVQSPFHHSASNWGLDKPIVIGEFFLYDNGDGNVDAVYNIPWQDMYVTLHNGGYAGAMAWQWYDNYVSRQPEGQNWPRALANIQSMMASNAADVTLRISGLRGRFGVFPEEIEDGSTSRLSWIVRAATTVTLDGEPVALEATLVVNPSETTTYTLTACGEPGDSLTWHATVTVLDPNLVNRAFQKPVTASSIGNSGNPAYYVNDGNPGTKWSSVYADSQWITIDLGSSYDVHRIVLNWEAAYASSYDIDMSFDDVVWHTVHEERSGNGGVDTIAVEIPVPARFVRMSGHTRATSWGFSLWEFEIFGLLSADQPPAITLAEPIDNAFLEVHVPVTLSAVVEAGTGTVEGVDFYIDDLLAGTATSTPYTLVWQDPAEGSHALRAVARAETFAIHTTTRFMTISPVADSIRFEAEAGTRTGSTQVLSLPTASSGAFVRMQEAAGSSLTWSTVEVANGGNVGLRVRYRLYYDTPKGQYLVINGVQAGEIMFTGTAGTSAPWLTMTVNAALNTGVNSIAIVGSWGWMDFDFMEIRGVGLLPPNGVPGPEPGAYTFALDQNYPNPFNPSTTIPYRVERFSRVRLEVYDLLGRNVATLVDKDQGPGSYEATFLGRALSSGVYVYTLRADGVMKFRRMTLLK